ncbi:hypothetical protein M885DRAFT_504515 [Pelagophyceae sp. CCMP2097]|nr:hypothetical protein M885DRAFT_504515 [Pelagophyceae sp. CCMP2097]
MSNYAWLGQSATAAAGAAAAAAQQAGAALRETAEASAAGLAAARSRHAAPATGPKAFAAPAAPDARALAALRTLHALAQARDVPRSAYDADLRTLWARVRADEFRPTGPAWDASLGFGGDDPVEALAAGGPLALQALVYFAERHSVKFAAVLEEGPPLGLCGVRVARELARLLDLASPLGLYPQRRCFWRAIESPEAYFELFSVGVAVAHREWRGAGAGAESARLNAVTRMAAREVETLLAQGPTSFADLLRLCETVPGSPHADRVGELALAHTRSFSDDDDDEDEDDAWGDAPAITVL